MSHIQRETSCSRPRLNSNMDADLYGYKWARDNVGQSGATIYRLYGKPDAPELFLKHGKGSVANDVTDEMVRLNWLTEFMPLPTIKHFIRTPDDAWLLTTAIPGKTAFQVLEEYPDSGENIVDALAVFLRRLHSIPVCNCPFNSDRVFHLSRRSPTIFSAAMENRCSSFILSRFSGCILKLILRTMLTTSSGTVVGGVGFLGNRLS